MANLSQFFSGYNVPSNAIPIEVLVVGGGGGGGLGDGGTEASAPTPPGGSAPGGGGGGGRMIEMYGWAIPGETYTVVVGAGGAGGTISDSPKHGAPSRFGNVHATGGGRGADWTKVLRGVRSAVYGDYGSGGGENRYSSIWDQSWTIQTAIGYRYVAFNHFWGHSTGSHEFASGGPTGKSMTYFKSYANDGGHWTGVETRSLYHAAGGGGATTQGGYGYIESYAGYSYVWGGRGGGGRLSYIGADYYSTTAYFYAGGGNGGCSSAGGNPAYISSSAPGGGGYGGGQQNNGLGGGQAASGTANTGGGGGGGGNGYSGASGSGGSGIVIVSYENTYPNAASASVSVNTTRKTGYKTYVFTGSGSITF